MKGNNFVKKAFTLAEVLITLAILGFVASVTLPALMANVQLQELQAQFKRTFLDLNEFASYFQIENNETVESTSSEDNSVMEVALSTGESYVVGQIQGKDQKYPIPFVDFKHDGSYTLPEMSLSLHNVCEQSIGHRLARLKQLDSGQSYIIRFLANKKPNVRAIFVIRNKRFVCSTLSVTYDNRGERFVYEGEFFLYE